jgi:tetratricopeptide (TPR) repeat protein/transcriptional regulator with XRE-family HTH domain
MRSWREQRGFSLGRLGRKIRFNPSYMARAERGDQRPSGDLVTAYEHALDAGGSLVRNYRRIKEGEDPDVSGPDHVSKTGLHVANGHVALAEEMDAAGPSSEGISVPVRTDDGRIIFVSLSRRALLTGLGTAAALSASPEVAAAASMAPPPAFSGMNPIEHLRATRHVLIDNDNLFGAHQVIPVVQRQITAMKALRGELRGADRRALLQLQTQYAELCGWLHQDIGDFRASQHWMREALETSHMAGDPDLTTFILARRSQLAGDMRDPIEAVDVAEAAENMATPGSRLAATAATYGAHGYALRGEPEAAKRAYDHAHELRESLDADPESPWAVWLDSAYIEVQRAHSLALLGDHMAAAEGFRAAITQLPAGYHRDRGVYLAREAVAYAEAGEAEQAATVGRHALNIGIDTGSARITRELGHLDGLLNQWRSVPSVTEFQCAMNDAVFRQV